MSAASRWEWLDFDEAEAKQVRDFLSQDVDGEGVDPLRIGASVRDLVAEQLFPGTSTQYKRLRYVILVPAVLRKKGATVGNLTLSQTALNSALIKANPDETGVIGRRTPARDFVHLYWTAIRTWKMLTPLSEDVRDVTVANGLAAMQSRFTTDDEGNPLLQNRVEWHPQATKLADQFWADKKGGEWPGIHCSKAEVDFILDQWLELPDEPVLAVIASLVRRGGTPSKATFPWQVDVDKKSGARTALDRAKAVSLICWGVQLAYNFALLKEARKLDADGGDTSWKQKSQDLGVTEEKIDLYFEQWKEAFEREKQSLEPWVKPSTWKPLGSEVSRAFLASAASKLVSGEANLGSNQWFKLVCDREKVNPAPKLSNRSHLATWSGTPEMARRWDFRWGACVRHLVRDAENPRG
jgi:hypothetical protein